MILWFLRLFPQFREVEAAEERLRKLRSVEAESIAWKDQATMAEDELTRVREAYDGEVQAHLRTQDRLDAALKEVEHVWEIANKAIDGERQSYQGQINHLVQKSGGGVVYPEAHSLPENAVPRAQPGGPIGRAGRMLPSQMAAMAQRAAVERYVETLDPERKA